MTVEISEKNKTLQKTSIKHFLEIIHIFLLFLLYLDAFCWFLMEFYFYQTTSVYFTAA